MPRSGEPTRQKILDAAEQVIAEVGVDSATFSEINTRAGQRNNSATQYHFGDRVSLLDAVVERHASRIAKQRKQMLSDLGPSASMVDLVHALVDPLASCLDDESGRRYLVVQASLLTHPDREIWPDHLARPWTRPGIDELAIRVETIRATPSAGALIADHKREMASLLVFHALANRARQAGPDLDHSLFTKTLVVSLVALIGAEIPR